jgi:hypothetical protein
MEQQQRWRRGAVSPPRIELEATDDDRLVVWRRRHRRYPG